MSNLPSDSFGPGRCPVRRRPVGRRATPIHARNPRAQCPGVSPDLSTDRPYRGEGVAVLVGTTRKGLALKRDLRVVPYRVPVQRDLGQSRFLSMGTQNGADPLALILVGGFALVGGRV